MLKLIYMCKKVFYFLFLYLSPIYIFSQDLRRSNTYIDTYYQGEKHFSIKDASYIFYSSGNSEIYVVLNFGDLKCGVDSLDEWLLDLTDSKLVFKGQLPSNDLVLLSHHNSRAIIVNGEITFNGMKHQQAIEINFFEVSREALFYDNNSQDYFDRVSANLQFSFLPKDFGVHKKPHHLKKKISIAIGRGAIIELKSEYEKFIK
jgi:hypothetical protein